MAHYKTSSGKIVSIQNDVKSLDLSYKNIVELDVSGLSALLPKEEYRNVIFRNFKSAKDIVEESKSFKGEIIDDHVETESCEIFSGCGG